MIQKKINMKNPHEKALGNVLKGKNIEGKKPKGRIRQMGKEISVHRVGNDMRNK